MGVLAFYKDDVKVGTEHYAFGGHTHIDNIYIYLFLHIDTKEAFLHMCTIEIAMEV